MKIKENIILIFTYQEKILFIYGKNSKNSTIACQHHHDGC